VEFVAGLIAGLFACYIIKSDKYENCKRELHKLTEELRRMRL